MARVFIGLLLLLGLSVPLIAEESESFRTLLSADGIHISLQTPDGNPEGFLIEVNARGVDLESFQLRQPNRLVIDIHQSAEFTARSIPLKHPVLRQVRTGSHPNKTRVVFDLRSGDLPEFGTQKAVGQMLIASSNFDRSKIKPLEKAEEIDSAPLEKFEKSEALPKSSEKREEGEKSTALGFSVDELFFEYDKRPVENITVKNSSKHAVDLYAKACELVLNGSEEKTCLETDSMLVSPKRLSIKPGGARTLRVVLSKQEWSQEALYKIVLSSKSDDRGTDYLIRASANPEKPEPELDWIVKEGSLLLRNTGNIRFDVRDIQLCREKGNCRRQADQVVYAKSEKAIPIEGLVTASFTKSWSGKWHESVTVPLDSLK